MKEKFEFKNLGEMYNKLPPDKRPSDVSIDKKSIFDRPKSPAQIEIIQTANRLIDDHLNKLGIEHRPFDEKRIAFLSGRIGLFAGEYNDGDFITVDESFEANLETIVHEFIHAQSAEWRNYDENEVEDFLEKNKIPLKSGFHRHTVFKAINEGITEKIAREIIDNNPGEYERLEPLFEGRLEKTITEHKQRFQKEVLPNKIKERDEKIAEQKKEIEKLKARFASDIAEIDQKILKAETEEEKQGLAKLKEYLEKSLERDIQYTLNFGKLFDSVEFAQKMHDLSLLDIKDAYSFSAQNRHSYDFNVKLVTNLVEGIAKHNLKKNNTLNLDEEKEKVWKDLQEAYFHGRTVYLRKIDEAFGPGYLRRINKPNSLISEKEQLDFLQEMKVVVENI